MSKTSISSWLTMVLSSDLTCPRKRVQFHVRLENKRITTKRYLSPVEAYKLVRSIRSEGDIVHLPNQHFARYALFLNRPFIVTVHDLAQCCFNFDRETIREKILLNLDKRYIKRASHIIAISQSTKCDLIILDELGFVPFSKEGAEALFTFCSARYERGSLIITTNLDLVRRKEIFGDEALTGALLDRLTHRCHILEMNGESYRFRESLRRKEKV